MKMKNITYCHLSYIGSNETDCYAVSRCKLDLYYPCNKNNYPTVIWFHGGGLTSGEKYIPEELKEKGITPSIPTSLRTVEWVTICPLIENHPAILSESICHFFK